MRGGILALLAIALVLSPLVVEISEGARPPEADMEPAVLCYYVPSWTVGTYYVLPDKAIGDANIPYQAGVNYWVRMDTGEIVTAASIFAPGTYMIKGYSEAPQPWGPAPEEPASDAPSFDIGTIALIIAVGDLVGIAYLIIRRK